MSAIQLSFVLRLSSGIKTVHLLGSWDNYVGQLPLSKDKTASKSGTWKGTFRFQGSTLQAGQRYWYYYIIDGYHITHNPSEASTVEPTTGRELNVLDVPPDKDKGGSRSSSSKHSSSTSSSSSSSKRDSKHHSSSHHDKDRDRERNRDRDGGGGSSSKHHRSKRHTPLSLDVPKGRPLSESQIQAPKPMSPHATKHILDADYYDDEAIEELTARFGSADIIEEEEPVTDISNSPVSSSGSSLSFRSDSSSPNSSLSGYSTPHSDCSNCTCERYGITRKGERVKLDCGGKMCGISDNGSACSSSNSGSDVGVPTAARRNGVVVRA